MEERLTCRGCARFFSARMSGYDSDLGWCARYCEFHAEDEWVDDEPCPGWEDPLARVFRARPFVSVPGVHGQGRPRFSRATGRAYEASSDRAYKARVAAAWRESGAKSLGKAPVAVRIDAFSPLPKSAGSDREFEPQTTRPDADNIAKAVLDGLNGVAFDDDAQVVDLRVVKHPRTLVDDPDDPLQQERVVVSVAPCVFRGLQEA